MWRRNNRQLARLGIGLRERNTVLCLPFSSTPQARSFAHVQDSKGGGWFVPVLSIGGLSVAGAATYLYLNPEQREYLLEKTTSLWSDNWRTNDTSKPLLEKEEHTSIQPSIQPQEASNEQPRLYEETSEQVVEPVTHDHERESGGEQELADQAVDAKVEGEPMMADTLHTEPEHHTVEVHTEDTLAAPFSENTPTTIQLEEAKHDEPAVPLEEATVTPTTNLIPTLEDQLTVNQVVEKPSLSVEPISVPVAEERTHSTPRHEEPRAQAPGSPELFRDIYTMQKEAYEKALADKDAKLKRKLEKQKALLVQQLERELELVKQEHQREYERQEKLLLERYESQINHLQAERKKIAEEAHALVEVEKQKLAAKKQALAEKLQELHESRLALSRELQSKLQAQKQEHLAMSKSSISSHTIFLALVELSNVLEQHTQPFTSQLRRLQEAAKGEQVIEAAIGSVSTLAEKGVYSYDRLKLRFHQLQKHAHRAALVPPNGGMWWHALSVVFAATSLPPSLLHLQGEQTVEVLERASQRLDAGQLPEAIAEVERLQGLPKEMARDWLHVAKDRLLLEQALRTVTAELETSLLPGDGQY